MKEFIQEMEEYARNKNVPIIEKDSITFLMKYIKLHKVKNILEIGSAIGYSSILMASVAEDVKVTTIERDETRYMECLKNVKKCGMDKKINVVYQDALEVNLSEQMQYDLIFIDAAKGQYTKFFEKFKYFLAPNGIIVTDNLKFHGYVGSTKPIENRNLRGIVTKIEKYINFLKDNEEFETKFYDVGDGLSVSVKKQDK
ncbi:MAG TPA: O-methyltransferase [Bacilli bacterium]|jgi:O-methyltransferase family protein|nr:O-methyltransferase [Bacilli bacterium]